MVSTTDPLRSLSADKEKLKALLHQTDASTETLPRLYATVQELRQAMIDQGIRPEDNEFSRDVIIARYK